MKPVTVQLDSAVWFRLASLADERGVRVDQVVLEVVESAVGITPIQRDRDERTREIRRLHALGLRDEAIGKLVGCAGETVRKRRQVLGLSNNGKQGRKPYRAEARGESK